MLDAGQSARSVIQLHRIVSCALTHAVRWQLVGRNVAQAVTPPRPRRPETHALEPAQVRRVLGAAQGTPYHALLHLATYTGMRRSELLGVRWQDVDLDRGIVRVVQTVHQLIGKRIVFQEPKTASGR